MVRITEGEGPPELYGIMGEVMWNTSVLVRAAPLPPETA